MLILRLVFHLCLILILSGYNWYVQNSLLLFMYTCLQHQNQLELDSTMSQS